MGFHLHELLRDLVNADDSRQFSVPKLLALAAERVSPRFIVDFGCGAATAPRDLSQAFPNAAYIGVDVPTSLEAADRKHRADSNFVVYDGARLPFRSDSVKLVYSRQVLEHVSRPESAISEICRILCRDGLLIGSTSHLEAFHSYSYWNFTPYGLVELGRRCGLEPLLVAPGIDSAALLWRRFRSSKRADRWLTAESPGNRAISWVAKWKGWDNCFTNCVKLQFCGHFFFMFRKV